ncbi:Ig-like domain-containing protein [Nocardioides jiangxiensis]|uniref:Ig-like domain-containing protein n=1 Tax=Nocardioides jiangxiensis TaxID=3064524 RepID=A0ABT9B347_9ACTN|nr:Ig-like domain-containing protein [Nocardioides sp. WY-20]MDO7869277.1 Ig-like domain-containing protein [Nocardioides sp. WY-20]
MSIARRVRRGSGAAAVLLAVLTAPLTVLPAAPASAAVAAPTGLSPTGGPASNTPTLAWSRASGAATYDIQVDDDSAFGSPVINTRTTNTRFVADKVLPQRTHWWRVRSVTSSGTASSWSTAEIDVEAVTVPTPVAPLGDVLEPPADVPLLTWQPVAGASGYTVQVDETDDFISPLTTADTHLTSYVAGPLPKGSYFWRVKATRASGVTSAWSAPAAFGVDELPAVTITSPADDPDFPVTDVVLQWEPLAGAAYYELQVSTDTDFNTLVDPARSTATVTRVYGTRYSPATTYDNNQYYWRVRAVDTAGQPAPWSQIQAQFDRVWNDRPSPVHPLTSTDPDRIRHISGDPYFQWTPVPHASSYELQVGTDADFSPGTTTNCQVAGTTYVPGEFGIDHVTGTSTIRTNEGCWLVPGTVYHWRVRPLDRLGTSTAIEGLYSEPQTFVYDDPVLTDAGMSPADGETVDIPTLRWTPVAGAVKYSLSIYNAAGKSVKTGITTASTSYTPVDVTALSPAAGPFTWRISAITANDRVGSVTHQGTFQVSASPAAVDGVALTPLTGNDTRTPTTRAPALSWVPMPGAKTYQLFARPHGADAFFTPTSDESLGKALPYPAVTDTGSRFLTPGSYDWFVRAYDAAGATLGSGPIATFAIANLPAATGQRLALDGASLDGGEPCTHRIGDADDICDAVPATPVFDWDPVEGASFYIVYVSEDASFSNLVEPVRSVGATISTRYTPTMSSLRAALPDSQAGGAYYWFVRPCKSRTVCGDNPVSQAGAATNKFRKASPAIALTSPAAGASVATPELRLSWHDYLDTNLAATWPTTGEHPHQSATAYRVQVDDDSTFTSPLDSVVVDQPTYTAADRTYPDGVLFWRVQAIDAEGNGLTWSAPRSVTKLAAAPSLLPSAGATPVFRWTPQPWTGSYDIEVYKDADTAASTVNRVLAASTKQPAWVPSSPLPAAAADYVWRVRRRDATTGRYPGAWSTWGRFHAGGAAPALLAPADGAAQPANGPLFSWSPAPGAAAYRVEVTTPSGTSLSGTPKTTPATAWATVSRVPDGTSRWRVVALDAGTPAAVLGTSAWRTFTVDSTAPTVTSLTPKSPVSTSSFTARFSEPVRGVTTSTFKVRRSGTSTYLRAAVSLSSDGRQAVLNPTDNLRRGATYVVTLTSSITDRAGNRLATTSWSLRVG